MRYYSEDHVWVEWCNGIATLGISPHAAQELGELTFVELPRPGARVARGEVLCVVESVKTAADVASPVGGTVCTANHLLDDHPERLNASPEDEGWICRLADVPAADLASLLSPERYAAFLAHQAGL